MLYALNVPDFLLVVGVCAEDLPDEPEPWEEQLPHEVPAAADHADHEQDRENDWKGENIIINKLKLKILEGLRL